MEWIETNGGPFVMVPRRILHSWGGCLPSSPTERSDYDRACEIGEYTGTLLEGGKLVLVFGDEPFRTTSIVEGEERLVVRWIYAKTEHDIVEAIRGRRRSADVELPRLALGGEYILFDAAEPGSDIRGQSLLLSFAPAEYTLSTALLNPSPDTSVLVHIFSPV